MQYTLGFGISNKFYDIKSMQQIGSSQLGFSKLITAGINQSKYWRQRKQSLDQYTTTTK